MAANYVLLERIELNADAASVTFSNIPQSGYTDLKVVISGRSTVAQLGASLYMRFNGSSTTNTIRNLYGNGSSAASQTQSDAWSGIDVDGANASANVFSNTEIYFPNYANTSYNKSWSAESVIENNATSGYQEMAAGLWANTAAITSITFTIENASGNWSQYSTFSLYGLAAVGTTPVIAPKASGGNITTDGTYWIHTFNSTGAFVPNQTLSCDYLVVAGGGGGGSNRGGGAGAGGYLESSLTVAATSYTVTVGAGGSAGASGGSNDGTNGSNSIFSSITSTGGGGGARASANGLNGGSGGGCIETGVGGTGVSGQGFAGGFGAGSGSYGAGAGGGAGAVGANGTSSAGGNGGTGKQSSITGTSTYYAGGGGGACYLTAGTPGSGGAGGGGAGGEGSGGTRTTGEAGTTNLGGGGGGGGYSPGNEYAGGNGGSGVVIIRYTIA